MIDRGTRVELLERARRERNRAEASELSPGERLALSSRLLELAASVAPAPPASTSPTDEPPGHWLAVIRRLRAVRR